MATVCTLRMAGSRYVGPALPAPLSAADGVGKLYIYVYEHPQDRKPVVAFIRAGSRDTAKRRIRSRHAGLDLRFYT